MAPPLAKAYDLMRARYGHRGWWPGETPFEICVGAILTQNTNWQNVERALANLKNSSALSIAVINRLAPTQLAELLRPAGYYNLKAKRLQSFTSQLDAEFGGSLEALFALAPSQAREWLLAINGIGPETADSILLYAGHHPSFVVDAYTQRIFSRHHWIAAPASYDDVKTLCESHLSRPTQSGLIDYWQDYHAQLVQIGKDHCRPRDPRCASCPLETLLPPELSPSK